LVIRCESETHPRPPDLHRPPAEPRLSSRTTQLYPEKHSNGALEDLSSDTGRCFCNCILSWWRIRCYRSSPVSVRCLTVV
jgi:hypothetical protein